MRLFFALWPDAETRLRLDSLAERVHRQFGGRRTATDKLHLTLAFLGEATPPQADELVTVTNHLVCPSGSWRIDRLGHFPRGGIVWAGSQTMPTPLASFHSRLWVRLAELGFMAPTRPFRPHVTLLRKTHRPKDTTLPEPIEWAFHRAALVHSAVDGPRRRYVTLAQTPLPNE